MLPFRLPYLIPLFVLFMALQLTACASLGGSAGEENRKHLYLNARHSFAIEHPADWRLVKGPGTDSPAVRWRAPEGSAGEALVLPLEIRWDTDRLEEIFLAGHPGFTLASRTSESPDKTGRRLTGAQSDRNLLVYLLSTAAGGFILEFSAPPEQFDALSPLFREMAESFTVLEQPPRRQGRSGPDGAP